jgi:glycolate oxidase FAD binding subunit
VSELHQPSTIDELVPVVKRSTKCLAVGHRSKPTLSQVDHPLIAMTNFSRMLQYDPSEFTFTAEAGITIAQVNAMLASRNQYLPFDPMFVDRNATLGGTIAAGVSGPGRFRYGGIRDFILGIKFIDGSGNIIHAGGKVVKNAAGFDIPKLFVGSLGRLGIMVEVTMKVFPKPIHSQVLSVELPSHIEAMRCINQAAASHWELDAIEYAPERRAVLLKLAGPSEVDAAIAKQIMKQWPQCQSYEIAIDPFDSLVQDAGAFFIKVPITSKAYLSIADELNRISNCKTQLSVAANVLWISVTDPSEFHMIDQLLSKYKLSGLILVGDSKSCHIGHQITSQMAKSIQFAFDPHAKFARS